MIMRNCSYCLNYKLFLLFSTKKIIIMSYETKWSIFMKFHMEGLVQSYMKDFILVHISHN